MEVRINGFISFYSHFFLCFIHGQMGQVKMLFASALAGAILTLLQFLSLNNKTENDIKITGHLNLTEQFLQE